MPSVAQLSVKKHDGATDAIYGVLSGSGGDGSPAYWRQDAGQPASKPLGYRPTLKMTTSWNGPKTARQAKFNFVFPGAMLDAASGLYVVKDKLVLDGIMTVPQGLIWDHISEGVCQGLRLLATGLVIEAVEAGFAPT